MCKKGMSPKEIYEGIVDTLREDDPSYSTVKKWVAAFKLGRISTEDEHRPGRPVESVTQENIDKIHVLVMLDRRMTVGYKRPCGQTITDDYYANLVKQLREDIKEIKEESCPGRFFYHQDNAPSLRSLQAMDAIYDSGFELLPHAPYSPDLAPSDFDLFPHLKKSLSGIYFSSDEAVIDAVTSFFESLETPFFLEGIKALEHRWKKRCPITIEDIWMVCTIKGWSNKQEKARMFKSKLKCLLITLFDVKGLVHCEFVPECQIINQHYCLVVLRRLREPVRQKRPEKWHQKNWLLYHDNARPHTAVTVPLYLAKHGIALLPKPPYSPDLLPTTFSFTLKLKES
ncbi:hypothetical protein LAZ67_19002257 [Cordylochernes scorpioides]|uniref:Transposase n=1 Tax=Cordylochernes scorpioides TaxID=51811 RepID=A0ABY6LJC1_9ARAC|nr:hypothetical protein LAZ67_19002257 [Cordylochernes scorpioides]